MSTMTEIEGQKIRVQEMCLHCNESKKDVLVSCASIHCDNKVHVGCAVRPEGTRLHFCSEACTTNYFYV